MFISRNKKDLMIEVWERLDCESVGARELIAIEDAVRSRFGSAAIESPMRIARLLADEGAELRHEEIMTLFVERNAETPYDAALRNIIDPSDLKPALKSIRDLENLRLKFVRCGDQEGLRRLREKALDGKKRILADAEKNNTGKNLAAKSLEIAEWLTIWLQSPEIFENWIKLRVGSSDFVRKFGDKAEA